MRSGMFEATGTAGSGALISSACVHYRHRAEFRKCFRAMRTIILVSAFPECIKHPAQPCGAT